MRINFNKQNPLHLFNKRRMVIASSFAALVLCGVLSVWAVQQYHAEGGTYVNSDYATAQTSPIPLVTPAQALYGLNTSSAKTVENLGGFLLQSGSERTWWYRSPLVDNGQTHLIIAYSTNGPTNGKPNTQLYDTNIVTGQTSETDANLGSVRLMIAGKDGKIYFGEKDFNVYDPATHTATKITSISDGDMNSLSLAPNGAIYMGEGQKGYIDRYDPSDGSFTRLGIMDDPTLRNAPAGDGTYRYGFFVCSPDDRYVYETIRDQNEGYELVAYDRVTGQQKSWWRGSTKAGVNVNATDGKIYANYFDSNNVNHSFTITNLDDPVPFTGKEPAQTIDRDGTSLYSIDGWANDVAPETTLGYAADVSQATIVYGTKANNNGVTTVKYRACVTTDSSRCTNPWQTITLNDVGMSPAPIGRAFAYSDNELLIRGNGYGPYATINPTTKQVTSVPGTDGISFYNALYEVGKWFFAGYPQLSFDQWDPSSPWNDTTNPTFLPIPVADQGKYNYYIANDNQGLVYLGIHHERTDIGGSISWYNPATGESGGLREPFLNYDCRGLISAENGTKLIYSSLAVGDATVPKIFVIDTATKQVEASYDFPNSNHTGAMIEVSPGVILGVASGNIYKLDINAKTLNVIGVTPTGSSYGGVSIWNRQLVRGPDGYIWMFVDSNIYRIDPNDGSMQKIISNAPVGTINFFNGDLYIASGNNIYRVANLFVSKSPTPMTDTAPPSAPANLTATAKDSSSIDLTWSASTDNTGVTGYKIYRNNTEVGVSQNTTFADSGLQESTAYSYIVKAYDAAGNLSDASNTATATTPEATRSPKISDTTPPSAPANLTAMNTGSSTVALAWSQSTDNVGVTGYKVYRDNTEIATTVDLGYVDHGLAASTSYSYTIKAFDAAGNFSDASNIAKATTQPQSIHIPPSDKSSSDTYDTVNVVSGNEDEIAEAETGNGLPSSTQNSTTQSGTNSSTTPTPAVSTEPSIALPSDLSSYNASASGVQKLNVSVSKFAISDKIYTTGASGASNKNWRYELVSNGKKVNDFNFIRSWFLSTIHRKPTASLFVYGKELDNLDLRVVALDGSGDVVGFSDLFKLK